MRGAASQLSWGRLFYVPRNMKRYGYLWVTLILFLGSLAGHWTCAWFAYVHEQQAHSEPIDVGGYLVEVTRDTLENWQSEFLASCRPGVFALRRFATIQRGGRS
jgi:hypothetical protein